MHIKITVSTFSILFVGNMMKVFLFRHFVASQLFSEPYHSLVNLKIYLSQKNARCSHFRLNLIRNIFIYCNNVYVDMFDLFENHLKMLLKCVL